MDGDIEVISDEGQGASFCCMIKPSHIEYLQGEDHKCQVSVDTSLNIHVANGSRIKTLREL